MLGYFPSVSIQPMKFAELYPTDDELSNAVTEFGSWHQVVKSGLTTRDNAPRAA